MEIEDSTINSNDIVQTSTNSNGLHTVDKLALIKKQTETSENFDLYR